MATMDVDGWVELVQKCKYLPENDLKVRSLQPRLLCSMTMMMVHVVVLLSHDYGAGAVREGV